MKKYILFLFVFTLFVTLLGFNAKSASAANCAPGDLFNSTTGQPCGTTTTVVGCLTGYLFSPITGQRCTTIPTSGRLLTIGSKGDDVKSIQQILKNKGYSLGIIDGSYGPKTAKAVKDFQNKNDLAVTGNVDFNTRAIITTTSATLAPANMKLLVLLTKFQNTTTEPYSKSYMQGQVFTNSNSVKQFYEKVSYNRMSVTGDVFGWYTIPDVADGTCETNKKKWMDDAQVVAQQNGINLSQYTHIVFAFPDQDKINSGCNFPGEAYPFDVFPRALVFTSDVPLIIHELGHTLGLGHADSIDCGQDIIKDNYHSTCTFIDYGDPFDFMGTGEEEGQRLFSFSAIHRIGLGWLLPSNIQSITTSGTYVIHALETSNSAVQVLKIKKPDFENSYTTSQNDYYYIDYNPDIDYAVGKSVDGVVARIWNQDRGFATLMLDMTPKSCIPSPLPGGCRTLRSDWHDGMLKDGMTFVDNNGIRITQISHTSTEATVTITLPQVTIPTPICPAGYTCISGTPTTPPPPNCPFGYICTLINQPPQSSIVIDLTSKGIETKPDNYTVDYRVTFDQTKFNPEGITLELSCSPEFVSWTWETGGKIFYCTNRSDNNTGIDMQRFADGDYRATIVFHNTSSQRQSVVAVAKGWGGPDGKALIASDRDALTLPASEWGITQPSITATSPNGGESIIKGQYFTIQWSTKNIPTNAKMNIYLINSLSSDNSPTDQIATGLNPNTSQLFSWNTASPTGTISTISGVVPSYVSPGQYKIDLEVYWPVAVTADNQKGIVLIRDIGDNYFTITSN